MIFYKLGAPEAGRQRRHSRVSAGELVERIDSVLRRTRQRALRRIIDFGVLNFCQTIKCVKSRARHALDRTNKISKHLRPNYQVGRQIRR
jgi:hypothetical protein